MATEKNMSCAEFNEYVQDKPEIDKLIDDKTLKLAKKGNIILDGTLSAWITRDLDTFKLHLMAPLEVRINRIAERDNIDYDKALDITLKREKLEKVRFKKFYNFDIDDLSIYDISINTNSFELDNQIEILISIIKHYIKENNIKKL